MDLVVRPAVEADWPAIWRIFRAVVAAGETYSYAPDITEDEARTTWLHVAAGSSAGRVACTYVAVLGGEIVGTALVKPNLPGLGDHVANAGWMIEPALTGRGLGRAFAEAVIGEARQAGYEAMQFNAVVATNDRAVTLWRSLGFETIGTVPGAFRHTTQGPTDLLIMHRPI